MITSTLKMNSNKNWRSWKTNLSGLKIIFLYWRSKKQIFWQKLLKLKDKFFFGKEKFSLKKKCKMHLIQLLVKLKSSQWKRKFIEWNSDMNSSERNKRKWSKTWKDLSSREKQFNLSIFQRSKKRMPKTNVSYFIF